MVRLHGNRLRRARDHLVLAEASGTKATTTNAFQVPTAPTRASFLVSILADAKPGCRRDFDSSVTLQHYRRFVCDFPEWKVVKGLASDSPGCLEDGVHERSRLLHHVYKL
jgi:hypothetical protein